MDNLSKGMEYNLDIRWRYESCDGLTGCSEALLLLMRLITCDLIHKKENFRKEDLVLWVSWHSLIWFNQWINDLLIHLFIESLIHRFTDLLIHWFTVSSIY